MKERKGKYFTLRHRIVSTRFRHKMGRAELGDEGNLAVVVLTEVSAGLLEAGTLAGPNGNPATLSVVLEDDGPHLVGGDGAVKDEVERVPSLDLLVLAQAEEEGIIGLLGLHNPVFHIVDDAKDRPSSKDYVAGLGELPCGGHEVKNGAGFHSATEEQAVG